MPRFEVGGTLLRVVRILAVLLTLLGTFGYFAPILPRPGLDADFPCWEPDRFPPELSGHGEDVTGNAIAEPQLFPPGYRCTWQLLNGEQVTYRPAAVNGYLAITVLGLILMTASFLLISKRDADSRASL